MLAAVVHQGSHHALRRNSQKKLPVAALFKRQVPLAHNVQHVLWCKALEGWAAKGIALASIAAVVVRAHRAVGKIGLAAAAYGQFAPRHGAAFQQHNTQATSGSLARAHKARCARAKNQYIGACRAGIGLAPVRSGRFANAGIKGRVQSTIGGLGLMGLIGSGFAVVIIRRGRGPLGFILGKGLTGRI